MPEFTQDVELHSIEFGERSLAITFTDPTHVSKGVADTIRRYIDPALFPNEIADLIDTVRQLIDDSDVVRRNPPDRVSRGG